MTRALDDFNTGNNEKQFARTGRLAAGSVICPEGVKVGSKNFTPLQVAGGPESIRPKVASLRFVTPHGPCDGRAPRSLDTPYLSLNSVYGSELSFITAFMHTIMMTAKMR